MSASFLYVFSGGLRAHEPAVAAGSAPREAHGYFALRRRGHDVHGLADGEPSASQLLLLASLALQRRYVIPRTGLGYRLHVASTTRRLLAGDPDRVIVATNDALALPLLALRRRGRLANPVIYFSIGLHDRIARGEMTPGFVRRYRNLCRYARSVVAFTPTEVGAFRTWLGDRSTVALSPYGVDPDWWRPGHPPAGRLVLSAGRDGSRDFPTLDHALRDVDAPAVMMGDLARRQGIAERPGLALIGDVPIDRLRNEIGRAAVVALPIRSSRYGSGQTTALQAMAMGRPVLMTDTGWARAGGLIDGTHFVHVPAGDAAALAAALRRLLDDRPRAAAIGAAARRAVLAGWTADIQADLILSLADGQKSATAA